MDSALLKAVVGHAVLLSRTYSAYLDLFTQLCGMHTSSLLKQGFMMPTELCENQRFHLSFSYDSVIIEQHYKGELIVGAKFNFLKLTIKELASSLCLVSSLCSIPHPSLCLTFSLKP